MRLLRCLFATLLFSSSASLQAQGLGDFSAPPPERTPPKSTPKSIHKRPPRHRQFYEELSWFSRTQLCAGTSQQCAEAATWPFRTDFNDTYYLQVQISPKHCSPLYLDVELDGHLLGSSGLVNPGQQKTLKLGKLSKGSHVLRLSALGALGGCNRGVLRQWGVDLVLSNRSTYGARAVALDPQINAKRTVQTPAPVQQAAPPVQKPPQASKRTRTGTIQIINVSGRELTGLNAYSLLSSLSLAKDRGARAVVVNLERVTYMTDAGADALVQGEALFGAGNLAIANLRGTPSTVLENRAPGHFPIYPSKAAAVAALRRGSLSP